MRRFALALAVTAATIATAGAAPGTAGTPLPLDPGSYRQLAFFDTFNRPPVYRGQDSYRERAVYRDPFATREPDRNFWPFEPQRERGSASVTRAVVPYSGREAPGTILISTEQRQLYLVQPNGTALRYAIGVGRDGFQWRGTHSVSRKEKWPDWRPPSEMLRRRPDLPRYMAGGEDNPLGARAIYLGSTLYRIHGSNEPGTIGQAVSSGCFRMHNADVIDLFERVRLGAKVMVMR
ncbi:L,D-transpeptidase [Blastochloris viridis]|uniref:ErfK/YbiS/YcfS/YnhG protein n=1 Tax=Blastochloris viridis TaxID=1079 RepID=A0A0H5B920_BLAVI|nr:L,D-transpeptidase [Blastochloris viridis]ALK08038.1 putative L,D-transpeptidase ErfK/SrfK precursor [Blastochloris viridis]BAR98702.1 ErfK/YbiS/YcfS/YnhG protein [Blastochloris viridis]CUU43960.1 putative L,D-transpeptidase ErfK/SrfK precursor [Blastochloris viridis]